MSGAWVALLLALANQPQPERIVVTAAGTLDAQRLSDALRVYLGEFEIQIDGAPPDTAQDIRTRMMAARRLGESVRAVAVIHAGGERPDAVEIELDDLTTQKTLIASVPKPARDEDLYRTLALKIQALLRATLSEARDTLDPRSAAGRLAAQETVVATPEAGGTGGGRLSLEAGYAALSLTAAGATMHGLAVFGSWNVSRRFELAVGTAVLGNKHLSNDSVQVVAGIVPVFVAARARWRWRRMELLAGPSVEAALASITPVSQSDTVQVRSARNVILAAGAQAELRVWLAGPLVWYERAEALGVIDAPSYDVGGMPVLDMSRLHLTGSLGVGLVFR